MEVLDTAIREEKEIKGIQIGKEEVKSSLFADDMMLHIENPKNTTKKLLKLINEFSKIQDTKLIYTELCHISINNELSESEIKETIHLQSHQK